MCEALRYAGKRGAERNIDTKDESKEGEEVLQELQERDSNHELGGVKAPEIAIRRSQRIANRGSKNVEVRDQSARNESKEDPDKQKK